MKIIYRYLISGLDIKKVNKSKIAKYLEAYQNGYSLTAATIISSMGNGIYRI